jgi:hypothetical protein
MDGHPGSPGGWTESRLQADSPSTPGQSVATSERDTTPTRQLGDWAKKRSLTSSGVASGTTKSEASASRISAALLRFSGIASVNDLVRIRHVGEEPKMSLNKIRSEGRQKSADRHVTVYPGVRKRDFLLAVRMPSPTNHEVGVLRQARLTVRRSTLERNRSVGSSGPSTSSL